MLPSIYPRSFKKKNVCYDLHSKRLEIVEARKRTKWRKINGYYALFVD